MSAPETVAARRSASACATQEQMFYAASRHNSLLDQLFLTFVEDGLTREELEKNIRRRPHLWRRWENWLDKLPSNRRNQWR
jgi:hypothetical protein